MGIDNYHRAPLRIGVVSVICPCSWNSLHAHQDTFLALSRSITWILRLNTSQEEWTTPVDGTNVSSPIANLNARPAFTRVVPLRYTYIKFERHTHRTAWYSVHGSTLFLGIWPRQITSRPSCPWEMCLLLIPSRCCNSYAFWMRKLMRATSFILTSLLNKFNPRSPIQATPLHTPTTRMF